ncbi:unnamed protein product [Anisakis simplex]|uniref:G_PROTEIN_RECEP_F1_2 domain-containing protein n=1 Tax=Anisakis simplex TaxID=6269 RepID=A0A0M3K4S4_ANISI|nr:unnamed protein product [Anisakis simplex]
MAEEERECMEQVFVGCAVRSYPDLEKHSMQTLDTNGEHVRPVYARKYCAAEESSNRTNDVEVVLSNQPRTWLPRINASESPRTRNVDGIGPRTEMVNGDNLNNTDTVSVHSGSTWSERIQRLIPKVFTKNPRCDEVLYTGPLDVLRPDFTNPYDLKSKKQIAKREKRDRKALTKRLRARRRAELAVIAKREARERTISSAIELLLQLLRMMTSFAILVGNIRKTFIPAQFKWLKPGQNAFDNPGLLMLFRCTVFLDVLLFWTNVIWAYCLQWHLCCRLGLIKFWLWTLILITVGGIVMLIPMSYVQNDLDISWCRFVPNSSLAKYQPNW